MPPVPGAGVGSVDKSTSLIRVTPIAPDEATSTTGQPLGRSGLDVLDLLTTTDLVTARGQTGPVELTVGLEQARAALLRNLPGDSLAALDQVWSGASRTEEGWYLRSGALTLMGLPGESDRVAGDGLTVKPESLALRFLQSLARLATGDLSGARAALQPALARAPGEPVLMVQQALLLARQGDRAGAERLLGDLAVREPEHPAVPWGRAALLAIVSDATRQRSRPTPIDWPSAIPDAAAVPPDLAAAVDDIFGAVDPDDPPGSPSDNVDPDAPIAIPRREGTADVTAAALERFGARVAKRPEAEVAREARMLIRAFSAGGTLSTAVRADQAHAARVVLTTFAGVTMGEASDGVSPVRNMVEQLVPLLRQGRWAEAESMARRQSVLAREPIGRLLLSVIQGAAMTARGTPASGTPMVFGESDRGPVVPVRLGLALLAESPVRRVGYATPPWSAAEPSPLMVDGREVGMTSGGLVTLPNDEQAGLGWGAAMSAPRSRDEWADGAGVRAVALVCVVMAMGALVTGHGIVAIALGAGSAWLGLRRSGGERYGMDDERAAVSPDRDRTAGHDAVRRR